MVGSSRAIVRIAGPDIGQLIEHPAAVAGVPISAPQSLRASRIAGEMAFARTCYDHLAGSLGVALLDRLIERGLVSTSSGVALTVEGELDQLVRPRSASNDADRGGR